MSKEVKVQLVPLGKTLTVAEGTPLQDLLFPQGVEFPCGGRGRCKGCRVKVLNGTLPVTAEMRRHLSEADLKAGWRLACQCRADADLTLELAQWEAAILADESRFAFSPRAGWGVAVDLGTTTVVVQLLDLSTGNVLAVRMGLNAQARHGGDIMSRIDFAVHGGQPKLQELIRDQIGDMIAELLKAAEGTAQPLTDVVIVGNTVMHHLFCGISVEPLSHTPFESAQSGLQEFTATALGWNLPGASVVRFLPCLGSFVGSDILGGLLATKLHESDALSVLIDLGTNGEIVVGNRERMLCASTAAGPAFEGARISMGMRAATGAVSEVHIENGQLVCRVIGQGAPRGICGSGLVDAIAAGLNLRLIKPNGRLAQGDTLPLQPPVQLKLSDIRELQLAKGAIAAGVRLLLEQWGGRIEDVSRIYLAGAFGNYISRASAQRIGLLPFPPEKVVPSGNSALLGAKLALFSLPDQDGAYPDILRRVRHVELNDDPGFMDAFVSEMPFPE